MAKTYADGSVDALEYLEELNGGPLTFGRMMRSFRLCEEQSLAEFAARLGVSRQNLSDIEHERRSVSAERAAEWARVLGYHEGQFVGLAIEAQLRAAKLFYKVHVEPIRSTKPAKKASKKRAAA